ncbi:MAG: hypothetical protein LBL52_00985 [Rickettsiales bacterium]|jgi:hypothetical protein|nr:hypothetical protein [Rickettsiales bacterium]
MKSSVIVISVVLAAAAVFAMGAKEPERIKVEGVCERAIEPSKSSTEISVDVDSIISSGLQVMKKTIDKTIELYDSSPKQDVEGNLTVKVKERGKDAPEKDFDMPFSFAVPKLDENFDPSAFFGDIAKDLPKMDDVVKMDRKVGLADKQLEAEYKSCAAEALKDAEAKAAAKLPGRKLKLVSLSQDGGVKQSDTAAAGKVEMRVVLSAEYEAQ